MTDQKNVVAAFVISIFATLITVLAWILSDIGTIYKIFITLAIIWLAVVIFSSLISNVAISWKLISIGLFSVLVLSTLRVFVLESESNDFDIPADDSVFIYLLLPAILATTIFLLIRDRTRKKEILLFLKSVDQNEGMTKFIENSKTIQILGLTLSSLRANHSSMFDSFVEKPDNSLSVVLPNEKTIHDHIRTLGLSESHSLSIITDHRETLVWLNRLASKNTTSGTIRVRLSKYVPTNTILIINSSQSSSKMRVSFHIINGSFNQRPFAEITRDRNHDWFDYYYSIFNEFSRNSDNYELGRQATYKRIKNGVKEAKNKGNEQ